MTGTGGRPAVIEAPISRPLRKDAARNRELLIAAAREVFTERGLEVSLDDIARHAGLGVGTAYRHFSNKHELIRAISAQEYERLAAIAEDALTNPDPWGALVQFLERMLQTLAESTGLREVFQSVHDEEQDLADIEDRLVGALESLLGRGQKAGVVRPDAAVTDLAVVILMFSGVTEALGPDHGDLWRRFLPLVLEGLRPGGVGFGADPIEPEALRVGLRAQKERVARAARKR